MCERELGSGRAQSDIKMYNRLPSPTYYMCPLINLKLTLGLINTVLKGIMGIARRMTDKRDKRTHRRRGRRGIEWNGR